MRFFEARYGDVDRLPGCTGMHRAGPPCSESAVRSYKPGARLYSSVWSHVRLCVEYWTGYTCNLFCGVKYQFDKPCFIPAVERHRTRGSATSIKLSKWLSLWVVWLPVTKKSRCWRASARVPCSCVHTIRNSSDSSTCQGCGHDKRYRLYVISLIRRDLSGAPLRGGGGEGSKVVRVLKWLGGLTSSHGCFAVRLWWSWLLVITWNRKMTWLTGGSVACLLLQ